MTVEPPPRGRYWRGLSWVAVAAMVMLGLVYGLIVYAMTLYDFDSDAAWFTVFTLFTFVPALALWWRTHNRYWYGLAVGVAGGWALVGFLFWFAPFDSGPSDEEINQAIAEIRSSGTPAYYIGAEADGHHLAQVYRAGEFGAEGVTVGYGFYCERRGGAFCYSEVYIRTLSMSRGFVESYGCERVPPVLGVPAARRDHALMLFAGASVIVIEDGRYEPDLKPELALADRLRPLGVATAVTTLPPPPSRTVAYLDRARGSAPRQASPRWWRDTDRSRH